MVLKMVLVLKFLWMDTDILGIGRMIKIMVMANQLGKMELAMKAVFSKDCNMGKENSLIKTVIFMKDNGKMVLNMAKVL